MSLAHIFWSRWQCSNAKVSQQKAELVHTFNSEFNITDPRGHTGFSSLGFHHTHTTSWATFTVKISAKNTPHWWTKGDFTLSLHASRFFPHVHKLRSKLHPGTYINTCFTTLFFLSLCLYHMTRLNQSWMDYSSSKFDTESYPITNSFIPFPALQTIFIWNSYKHTCTHAQSTNAPRSVELSAPE